MKQPFEDAAYAGRPKKPRMARIALSSITPSEGETGGGTEISIGGANLEDVTDVLIGGTPARVTARSSGTVEATTLPREAGADLDVVVIASVGTRVIGEATLLAAFSYLDAPVPTVVSASPSQVDTHGGTLVKIEGTGFVGTPSITIDGLDAPLAWLESDTVLYARSPAHASEEDLDVVVTTIGGVSTGGEGFIEAWYPTEESGLSVFDSRFGVTGSPASAWADQGAGGNDLSSAGSARPAVKANAFSDGVTGLSSDGGDDVMTLAAPVAVPTHIERLAVIRWDTDVATGAIHGGTGSAVVDFAVDRTPGQPGLRTYDADEIFNHHQPIANLNNGSPYCVAATHDGVSGDLKFRKDGAQIGGTQTDTFGNTRVNWDRVFGAAGNFFKGYVGAVLVKVGTITDFAKCETWCRAEFVQQTPVMSLVSSDAFGDPRDGALMLKGPLAGEWFILFGWNNNWGAPLTLDRVTNEVLRSTDDCVTFTTILARDASPPANRPPCQHSCGWLVKEGYIYAIGGDGAYSNHREIYRAPITADGLTNGWEHVATGPWPIDCLSQTFAIGSRMWKIAGQEVWDDPGTAHRRTYYSDDDGETWTQGPDCPAELAGGLIQNPLPVAVIDGRLQAIFVCGGGTSDTDGSTRTYRNSVITFDGETYTTHIADGAGPFSARVYPAVRVFRDRVALWNGARWNGSESENIGDMWSARLTDLTLTGWRQEFHGVGKAVPWLPSHADGVAVDADRIMLGPGNGGIGNDTGTVHKIEPIPFA